MDLKSVLLQSYINNSMVGKIKIKGVGVISVLGCRIQVIYKDLVSQEDADIDLYFWKLVPLGWGAAPG